MEPEGLPSSQEAAWWQTSVPNLSQMAPIHNYPF